MLLIFFVNSCQLEKNVQKGNTINLTYNLPYVMEFQKKKDYFFHFYD